VVPSTSTRAINGPADTPTADQRAFHVPVPNSTSTVSVRSVRLIPRWSGPARASSKTPTPPTLAHHRTPNGGKQPSRPPVGQLAKTTRTHQLDRGLAPPLAQNRLSRLLCRQFAKTMRAYRFGWSLGSGASRRFAVACSAG